MAFVSKFGRGRLRDLVALLSGRDFENRTYEEAIAEDSFSKLRDSVLDVVSKTHFKRFLMILRSAGIINPNLIGSVNVVNYAFIVYLLLRDQRLPAAKIESLVRRAYVLNVLAERFSGNPEGTFDFDIRRIKDQGFPEYLQYLEDSELGTSFWDVSLPQKLNTPVTSSPFFRLFLAAQVHANDKGFLSKSITVRDLIQLQGDRHHIYPKNYLKKQGYRQNQYNQVANYAMTQSEINIQIGDHSPKDYFETLRQQCFEDKSKFGAINTTDEIQKNLWMNCIPNYLLEEGKVPSYEQFLSDRRTLMAQKIRLYYESL